MMGTMETLLTFPNTAFVHWHTHDAVNSQLMSYDDVIKIAREQDERLRLCIEALNELVEASKKHEKNGLWNSHWRLMWEAGERAIKRAKP